jgi:hypothetical protein
MKGRANQTTVEHQEVDLVSSTYRLVTRRRRRRVRKTGLALCAIVAMDEGSESPAGARTPFLGNSTRQSVVPPAELQSAANALGHGDLHPYGLVVVPRSSGALVKDEVLVGNFNNAAKQQDRRSTVVEVAPDARQTVSTSRADAAPGGVGLTTALADFPQGTSATARAARR